MTNPADRARAEELLDMFNGDDLRFSREAVVDLVAKALAAARESALREAVDKLSDLPGPRRSCCTCCDDGYGDAVDHALAAVRALLPAPPPPPTKGTT